MCHDSPRKKATNEPNMCVCVYIYIYIEMLIYALRAHVKDFINKNFVSEIVLIYYLKI